MDKREEMRAAQHKAWLEWTTGPKAATFNSDVDRDLAKLVFGHAYSRGYRDGFKSGSDVIRAMGRDN